MINVCASNKSILSLAINNLLHTTVCRLDHVFYLKNPNKSLQFHTSSFTSEVSNEILTILETTVPSNITFSRFSHFLNSEIVTSVISESRSPESCLRFAIWAMRRRTLFSRHWHNLITDMLIKDDRFDLFLKIIEDCKASGDLVPSDAFSILIHAYSRLESTEKAVEIFGRMRYFDCKPNVFTYNAILGLFLRKNVFMLALAVYNEMVKLNVRPNQATFSILINGFFQTGKPDLALKTMSEMILQGRSPNLITYTVILSGFCRARRTDDAISLIHTMKSSNCHPDQIAHTTLLDGFCKSGKVDEALILLHSFQKEGYVLGLKGYSCLIYGLFKQKRFKEAHIWYEKMRQDGVIPDIVLYTIMIQVFSGEGRIRDAIRLFGFLIERGLVPDTCCYNAMIKAFCDVGLLDKARSLQLQVSRTDGFMDGHTHTIIICGFCEAGLVGEAEKIFEEMEKLGCSPSIRAFNALINGLCREGEVPKAQMLVYKTEIGRNPSLFLRLSQGNEKVYDGSGLQSMVERLCEVGRIADAYRLISRVSDSGVVPDIKTYTILINGFCKARDMNSAITLFKDVQLKGLVPDSVTYGALIGGLLNSDREEDAFAVFEQMKRSGCRPSPSVYKLLMTWASNSRRLSLSFGLWMQHLRNRPERSGDEIEAAEDFFEKGEFETSVKNLIEMDLKLKDFDLGPYTIWITGLCTAKRVEEALKLWFILLGFRIAITPPCCVMLIDGLCEIGNLDMASCVFGYTLDRLFVLKPKICNRFLVSLLSCEDNVGDALSFIRRMESGGYNLDFCLSGRTKYLLSKQQNRYMVGESSSPG